MAPETCPNCGAEVPPKARACPACGADEHTGWSDHAVGQRLDLPDEDFDYDAFVQEEFGGRPEGKWRRSGLSRFWWAVALAVAAGCLAWMFGFRP